jgi:hypothetical protein
MSSDSHYVAERSFAQRLDDLYYKGVYCPMAKRVDVQVNLEHVAEFVPVFFEGVVIVGIATARQEKRLGISKRIQTTMCLVNMAPLRVDVCMEHPAGLFTEPDHFHSSPITAEASGPSFLLATALAPVPYSEILACLKPLRRSTCRFGLSMG